MIAVITVLMILPALGWAITRRFESAARIPAQAREMSRLSRLVISFISLAWLMGIWIAISLQIPSAKTFVPTPLSVLKSFLQMVASGEILNNALSSIARLAAGFLLAAISGTILGVFATTSPVWRQLVLPANTLFRFIPATVFSTVLILGFGIGELSKILLVFLGTFFYIVQMVVDACSQAPQRYVEQAATFGLTKWEIIVKILLPASAPGIVSAWRINFAAAWIFLLIAELISANSGLGAVLSSSFRVMDMSRAYAAILMIGLLAFVCDCAFALWMKRRLNWI